MNKQCCFMTIFFLSIALLLAGCASPEMKGTPFYSGEYHINVPGADARRVNLWPLAYYRDPALSVAWPVFEHTEEHLALRPIFSAYGDTNAYSQYNVLWPLCQADASSHDYRIFPAFWGRTGEQDYQVLFPLFWRYAGEKQALFPLWFYNRDTATDRDLWLLWPLLRYHTSPDGTEWHALLFGDYRYPRSNESYSGYPWPLFFSWHTRNHDGLFTPIYAHQTSTRNDVTNDWEAIPPLLSWHYREGAREGVTAGLGLYHRTVAGANRRGWLFPLFAYDTQDQLFLTPLFGWDKPREKEPDDGYWYPLTPLAGFRTGRYRGGWLFPLWDHRRNESGTFSETHFLLFGKATYSSRDTDAVHAQDSTLSFFPLFSHTDRILSRRLEDGTDLTTYLVRKDRQLLIRWSDYDFHGAGQDQKSSVTSRSDGLFPLWDFETKILTGPDGLPFDDTRDNAILLFLYDFKRKHTAATDYVRRRILWRVWHYEKRNDDSSMDLFPFITHDVHADGFRKTTFLWRLFRHETSPLGETALDILFLPIVRGKPARDTSGPGPKGTGK
jgi:hypothetical protein